MVVGLCRVVLSLPGNDSLKGKRSVVKSVLERARGKFHVAAAEIDDLDVHRRAVLGFSLVSNDARHTRQVLDKLVSFVAGATEAELSEHSISVEHHQLGAAEDASDLGRWEDDDGDEEG